MVAVVGDGKCGGASRSLSSAEQVRGRNLDLCKQELYASTHPTSLELPLICTITFHGRNTCSMSINRSASLTPSLFRTAARTTRSQRAAFPTRLQAIAILVPRRAQSTDTSTSSTGGNYPPPGFNSNQAKKPAQDIERKQRQSAEANDAAGARQQLDKSADSAESKNDATSAVASKSQDAKALSDLAAETAVSEKAAEQKLEAKKKEDKKLTLWQKVKREAAHYWDGTKLLVTEVKISSKLALKMAAGYELTRREHRQVSASFWSVFAIG